MASNGASSIVYDGNIVISANDKRQYRYITLTANGLPCLLVSDPTTEKSAACCDVHVGSLSDPSEAQGLAHFLEHMLFMGTEKYPTENAYSAYLNNHGGSSNAYTSTENTVYYFDVLSDHFEGALDLFSTFFTCPLFTESGVMREIQAVDSENSKNLQNDWWRKFQLFKSLARPDHALNSFSTGNLQTLHEVPTSKNMNIRQLMLDFYHKYYSANLMRLTVYGAASLDQLEAWTVEKFSGIVNKNLQREVFPTDPFRSEQLKKRVEVVPVRDLKNLEILFPIPPIEDLYLTKPVKYFGHLIGHESGGSILAALKAKRWANGLSCYPYPSCRDFACYVVSIDMTEEGIKHIEEIVTCVFAYVGMIKRSGPQDWVWQELKGIAEMNYRFLDKVDPIDYVVKLANNMQIFSPEHVLAGDALHFVKDLAQAMEYLEHIRPDNCVMIVSHKGFTGATASTEKWYGTPYNLKDLDNSLVASWQSYMEDAKEWSEVLQFPQPNIFIPEDFGLKSAADTVKYPSLLKQDIVEGAGPLPMTIPPVHETASEPEDAEDSEDENAAEAEGVNKKTDTLLANNWLPILPGKKSVLWYKDDSEHRWDMPKTLVSMVYESYMGASVSAWQVAMTDVYSSCLNEVLSEYSYYADCAGISFGISTSPGGISMSAQGYSDKLALLIERACTQARRVSSGPTDNPVNEALFLRVKEKVLRSYKNYLFSQPYNHCILSNSLCLEDPRWSYFEKYAALKEATLSTFYMFATEFLKYGKPEILVTGNCTIDEVTKYKDIICNALQCLPLPFAMEYSRRAVDIFTQRDNTYVLEHVYRISARTYNPAEVNSAVENLYLIGPGAGRAAEGQEVDDQGILTEALLALLGHMMSEPAFDVLRTKEQLGYIVYAFRKRLAYNILTMAIIVQSSHKDASYLDSRVEHFLETYREELEKMSAESLQSFIQAVIEKLLEKPKNLDDESGKYREEISNKTYLFDRKDRLVEKLRNADLINHASVLQFFDSYLRAGSEKRRKFSTEYYGKQHEVPPSENFVKEGWGKPRKLVVVQDPSLFKRMMAILPVQTYEPL